MERPMPRAGAEPLHFRASKPVFPHLVKELANDGKSWLDAELALAKAEAGLRLRDYAVGLGIALVSVVILVTATVILAQACVAALTPYLSGPAVAGVVVGIALIGIVVILAFVAKYMLVSKTPPTGLIFRWLTGNAPESRLK
jgi:hypothetical protein